MDNTKETASIQKDESLDVDKLMGMAHRKTPSLVETSESTKHEHGEIVDLEDGDVGIVIDNDHEMNKMLNAARNEKLEALIDESVPIYEKMSATNDSSKVDYGRMILSKEPHSDNAKNIMEVKEAFANFSPSINGLAPSDSEQARLYNNAMEALRSGEYVLPTVEEYNKQKMEVQKRKEQEAQRKMNEQNNNAPIQEEKRESKTINLAEMEEVVNAQQQAQARPTSEETPASAQDMVPKEVAEFKVPEGRVHDFVETLTPEQREKVETSKVIEVREVRQVDVPVATRVITSIDQYKRIASKKVTSEAVEVPLLNSGYVATVKGCGSLEMASILPDVVDMEWDDYAKLYTFCYSNLVNASIGQMSYRSFCVNTSPDDLPAMIHAILRASVPDEQSVTLTCGGGNCGKDYDITYYLSELADLDTVDQKVIDRIDQIMSVKNTLEDARRVQRESPVMVQKYIYIGDGKTVCIRNPNGPITVERTKQEFIDKISEKYNQLVALYLLSIEKITEEIVDDASGETVVYDLIDPEVIAENIQTFSDTQLEILKEEFQKLESFPQYTYSFKGRNSHPIICPHCKLENKRIPCKVQQLVFQRVSRAMS